MAYHPRTGVDLSPAATTTTIEILTTCPSCSKQEAITVPLDGYQDWQRGTLIQRALPSIPPSVREQLITGICSPCWTSLFAEEDR